MIEKDVNRTYAEIPVFCLRQTRADLNEVLYIWSVDNPEYGYQ